MAKRRGRKQRQLGARGASGRLLERSDSGAIPPEALQRRAEMLGIKVGIDDLSRGVGMSATAKRLAQSDASSALGMLLSRGVITQHQYDAGQRLWGLHSRWKCAVGGGTRYAKTMNIDGRPMDGVTHIEMDDEVCEKIERQFREAANVVPRGLCWQLVEAVAIDPAPIWISGGGGSVQRIFDKTYLGGRLRGALCRGLDSLADHLNIKAHTCTLVRSSGAGCICSHDGMTCNFSSAMVA